MVKLDSIREAVLAAERERAMQQRWHLQPRQSSLENAILPSPSADLEMAADLLPTPTIIEAAGNKTWEGATGDVEEASRGSASPAAATPGGGGGNHTA